MPTTIEKGMEAHEHTQHSAHTGCQPSPQPEDSAFGPAAGFRQADERNIFRGAHEDANRECSRRVAAIAGARTGRPGVDDKKHRYGRRGALQGGGFGPRDRWAVRDWRGICAVQSALLAGLLSAGGLERAESRSETLCIQLKLRASASATKGPCSQEVALSEV